jgi:hypothetical protein
VKEDGVELGRGKGLPERRDIVFVEGIILPSSWVTGEELNRFTPANLGPFDDLRKPTGNRDMEPESHLVLRREIGIKLIDPRIHVNWKIFFLDKTAALE